MSSIKRKYECFTYIKHLCSGKEYIEIAGFDNSVLNPVIPSHIDDIPVVKIGEKAFCGANIKTIKIPDTVEQIERGAFTSCSLLKELNIPDSVISIEFNVCSHCDSLESVKWSKSTDIIPSNAFYQCSNLKNITGIDTVNVIDMFAFAYSGLTSINLPPQLITISRFAFSQCEKLKLVKFNSYPSIHADAFWCSENIKIDCGKIEKVKEWALNADIPIFESELNSFLNSVCTKERGGEK